MNNDVVLDANVFVLFVIGLIDRKYIKKFIRTKCFSESDFDDLCGVIHKFKRIIITPHILTEFSHLTLEEKTFRDEYKKLLKGFLLKMQSKSLIENHVEMKGIFENNNVFFLGVADVSLMEVYQDNCTIITSDGPFGDRLKEEGKTVLKFIPTEGFVNH